MQTVSTAFDDYARGPIRPLSWQLRISFNKQFDDSVTFFTLGTSTLDGPDILAPSTDNVIQAWDYYQYLPYSDRVQMLQWSREIEFPYSVSSAMADFVLENHDDYFTPDSGSSIDAYILPKRPLRILSGFNNLNLPQFVGMTEKMPVIADRDKTATFHALDFLSELYTMPTTETLAMQNARTHEVLATLFEQFGLAPEQYDLTTSSNVIPFVFYERGATVGDVMRKLMQAEVGNLWLDETGIIRLSPRVVVNETSVYTFDESNTIDVSTTGDDSIINRVVITAQLREVQPFQTVHIKAASDSELIVVPAGGTYQYQASLQDPLLSVQTPTLGLASGVSWFTAEQSDETPVVSGVSVTATELRTNSYVITFSNANAYDVNIDRMEIWGEPAKVVDKIEYTEVDQDSIEKYGEKTLEIDNPFLQTVDQCESLALTILEEFSAYAGQLELEVKGNPALQLSDVVTVDVRSYSGTYKIVKALNTLQSGKYGQRLTVRRHVVRPYFILDSSLLDSTDQLTP